jgi:hypothetical protein
MSSSKNPKNRNVPKSPDSANYPKFRPSLKIKLPEIIESPEAQVDSSVPLNPPLLAVPVDPMKLVDPESPEIL